MSMRSSRLASRELSTSVTEVSTSEPVITTRKPRSKSKDVTKAASKAAKKSPSKKSPARTKSKSPARAKSPSRAKKATVAAKRQSSSPAAEKPTRGAKLYTKKDLVQDITPQEAELPKKRTLRSSSSKSSMSELNKAAKKTELEATPECPVAKGSCCSKVKNMLFNFCPIRYCPVTCPISCGYIKANKCMIMRILIASLLLLVLLAMFNYYEAIAPAVSEQAQVILNSVNGGLASVQSSLLGLKNRFI